MEKIKVSLPIIVEGRYDKSTLSGFVDATVITTDGFSVFNNKEKQMLIRRLCSDGAIILTDSDGGGKQIRSFLSGIVGGDKIYNLYIPKISGKEKRKQKPSAAGTLGVEGMSRDVLSRLLEPFATNAESVAKGGITKTDFFVDGLSGGANSSLKRAELARLAALPDDISANALLEALNILYSYDEYKEMVSKIN
jgi:ribonuclease M5